MTGHGRGANRGKSQPVALGFDKLLKRLTPIGGEQIERALAVCRQKCVQVRERRAPVRNAINHAGDYRPARARANQNDIAQILEHDHAHHIFDVDREANGRIVRHMNMLAPGE